MLRNIKSWWNKNGMFFTFNKNLNLPTILILYGLILCPFYFFSWMVNSNFFTIKGQIEFIKIAWLPLIFYAEFVIIGYLKFRKKGVYPEKLISGIISKKQFFKELIKNNHSGYKVEISRLIIFIISYILVTFILFNWIKEIYFGELSKFILLFASLSIIKIYLIFFISDLISPSKAFRSQTFYLLIGVALCDFIFIAVRLIFEKTPQVDLMLSKLSNSFLFIQDIISKIPGSILTVVVVFFIGIFVIIFLPQKRIMIYGSERTSPIKAIFLSFMSMILFGMITLMFFISPKFDTYSVEPLFVALIMREFILFAFILSLSLLFISRIMAMIKNESGKYNEFHKIKVKIEGFSQYTNKRKISEDLSFDNMTKFLLVKDLSKSGAQQIQMVIPKRNLFSPLHNQFYVGDELEVLGFFFKINDLKDSSKKLEMLIPVIVRVTKFSKIREIIP